MDRAILASLSALIEVSTEDLRIFFELTLSHFCCVRCISKNVRPEQTIDRNASGVLDENSHGRFHEIARFDPPEHLAHLTQVAEPFVGRSASVRERLVGDGLSHERAIREINAKTLVYRTNFS
jgi:hypothetical protein